MGHGELTATDRSPSNPPAAPRRRPRPPPKEPLDSPVVDAAPLGRPLRDRLELVLLGLVAAAVAVTGWLHRWTADDAFINFRVVDNVLAGNGPIFNAREWVEVATSGLWLALPTAPEAFVPGTSVDWFSVVLGLACTVLGVAAATFAARRLFLRTTRWLTVPFGAVALAALSPFWDFATSGLETGRSCTRWRRSEALLVAAVVLAALAHTSTWSAWAAASPDTPVAVLAPSSGGVVFGVGNAGFYCGPVNVTAAVGRTSFRIPAEAEARFC